MTSRIVAFRLFFYLNEQHLAVWTIETSSTWQCQQSLKIRLIISSKIRHFKQRNRLLLYDILYRNSQFVCVNIPKNSMFIRSGYCVLRLSYSGANKTVPDLILGLRYVPLRAMFAGSNRKIQKEAVKQVLVSTGGADGLHIALRLARKVFEQKGSKYRYHFLIGPMNQDKDELYAMSSERDAFSLIENNSDMKSLIDKMDIVVSAAGSTLYEICSCGVPLITYAMADNQIRGAKAFEQMDLAISLGDLRKADDPIGMIMDAIDRLSADYTRRTQIGTRMQELVDGRGANRLVHKILGAS